MGILAVVLCSAVLLALAYRFYGNAMNRWLGVNPDQPTPAITQEDGVDFVPAGPGVVLGGHFTAIAAAGPIVGPILAAQMFGWVPALIWILVGAILVGGIHDAGALMASIRHNAMSITQVVRQHMSHSAYVTFLIFIWIALVYVIIAFADITAGSFAKLSEVTISSTTATGTDQVFKLNGGAVAIGATAYLVASVILGLLLKFTKLPWWLGMTAMVVALGVCIHYSPAWAEALADQGWWFMNPVGRDAAGMGDLRKNWDLILLGYCFVASVTPMWILLQPRGVIGAIFLYAALVFGIVGTLIGGLGGSSSLTIQWPAFKDFVFTAKDGSMLPLFPFLFITIACGACSGFHSIVASGTTCKQIRNERDIKPVAYGAMLLESMVAVLALACVMVLAPNSKIGDPDAVYARGLGNFMNLCGVPLVFAIGFGLLAFSSFVFDTMDVCTRLGRYVLQELLGVDGFWGATVATGVTLIVPAVYLWLSPPGSFMQFWTLFGTSNQLLAALTLVGISVWLWRTGRPVWYALLPALFMLVTTITALVMNGLQFWQKISAATSQNPITSTPWINMVLVCLLLLLALFVTLEAVRVWHKSRREPVGTGGAN